MLNITKHCCKVLCFTRSLATSSRRCLDIGGVYPPIPVPFKEGGQLHIEKLKSNLQKWNKIPFKGNVKCEY